MNAWWFWQNWPTPYRVATHIFVGIAFLFVISFLGLYVFDIIPSLGWDVISRGEWLTSSFPWLEPDTHSANLQQEFLLVQQLYRGKPLHLEAWWGHAFLGLIGFILVLGLSLISTLPRIWYIAGMTAFVFFVFFWKLDLLEIPIAANRGGLILALGIFLPLSYYLHAIRPQTNYWLRIGAFTLATAAFFIFASFLSTPDYPLFFLGQYAVILPIFIILLFIITIAHEPIAGLVFVATQAGGRQSVIHYSTFTALYLGYIFISYLHATNYLHWDIYYLDGYLLLAISSVLGLWGIRQRAEMASRIMPFQPKGAWLYLLMMVCTWGTLLYFWVVANDPMIETIEEVTYMAHMGFGIVFFLYTLSNFYTPMRLGKAVSRVLYKPQRMPFYVFRFMGIIASIAAGYQSSNYPITRTTSGYFNGIGDAYALEDNEVLAQAYYLQGRLYSQVNHRSNYALASLAVEKEKTEYVIKHLSTGIQKNPLPQTYVNLSLMLQDGQQFFDAKFQLEDGVKAFPNSAPIANNLGLLYYQTNFPDSAAAYFLQALPGPSGNNPASTNLWSISAKLNLPTSPDSIINALYQNNLGVDANLIALLAQKDFANELDIRPPALPKDSILSQNEFARLYNYALLKLPAPDTGWLNDVYEIASHPENNHWWERIALAKVWSDYRSLNISEAFEGAQRLGARVDMHRGYYENLQGLMALDIGLAQKAIEHFIIAVQEKYPRAQNHLVFAYLEADEYTKAVQYLTYLEGNNGLNPLLQEVKSALLWQADQPQLSVQQMHWVLRYRHAEWSPAEVLNLWRSLPEGDTKALAGLALLKLPQYQSEIAKDIIKVSVSTPELAQRIAFSLIQTSGDITQLANLVPQTTLQRLYAAQAHSSNSEELQRLALHAPFQSSLVTQAVDALTAEGDTLAGYALSQSAILFNPWDAEISKTYALQAIKSQYPALGDRALAALSMTLPKEEYLLFEKEYNILKEQLTPTGFK